jgi:sugar phosphate isomerase/epimerase
MKLAICNETFGDWPFDKAFGLAAECGYQGVEIAPFTVSNYVTDIPSKRREEIRRQAESAGLAVVGLHWLLRGTEGFHLTSPDREIRRRTAKYLGELAQFCADLGGELLVFGSPKQRDLAPGIGRDKGMQWAAEVLRETLPALERTGVRIAMEPLSPKTTNFLSTAADAAVLVRRTDSPRCRLILDCVAMSSEPTPAPDLIRRYSSLLIHFHANDPNNQGPGMGKLDFQPIFQALQEVNYRGWISVEVFDYSPGAERIARESIQYMRKVLRPLSAR